MYNYIRQKDSLINFLIYKKDHWKILVCPVMHVDKSKTEIGQTVWLGAVRNSVTMLFRVSSGIAFVFKRLNGRHILSSLIKVCGHSVSKVFGAGTFHQQASSLVSPTFSDQRNMLLAYSHNVISDVTENWMHTVYNSFLNLFQNDINQRGHFCQDILRWTQK